MEAHPGKCIALWFQDGMRVGRKGRLRHRWWSRGRRPPGRQDQRFEWTCVFGAARPDGEAAFGRILPEVGTLAMQTFLAFAETIPEHEHAIMVLERAGWHGAKALRVPPNVTLVLLPPYSPQLNPMERVWLWLRERFLSLRVFADFDEIVDACCRAWNAFADDPDRIRFLCLQPWIRKAIG